MVRFLRAAIAPVVAWFCAGLIGAPTLALAQVSPDRLDNGDFDAGLTAWNTASSAQVSWRGAPDVEARSNSGALRWSRSGSGLTETLVIARQCLRPDGLGRQRIFEGALFNDGGSGYTTHVVARYFASNDCSGAALSSVNALSSNHRNTWKRFRVFNPSLPSGTRSVQISLEASLNNASGAGGWFDGLYFGPTRGDGAKTVVSEGFDLVDDVFGRPTNVLVQLNDRGFHNSNLSSPIGSVTHYLSASDVFPTFDGGQRSFLVSNFLATTEGGTISHWLISPELQFSPDRDCASFLTRQPTNSQFADRAAIRLSTAGASINVGDSSSSIGDFTTLLAVMNPDYKITPRSCPIAADSAYPDQWCEIRLCGLPDSGSGRIGYRYSVINSSVASKRGNFVAIDRFRFPANEPLRTPQLSIITHTPQSTSTSQPFTVGVSITGNGPTPTGAVRIGDGADGCTLRLSGGSGSCNLALTTAGNRTLTALYEGDSNYAGAVAQVSHTVGAGSAAPILNITSDTPDPSNVGQAYTVTVTVSGAVGAPTGNVGISDGSAQCSISLNAGAGSCQLTSISAGSMTLTASYSGDANYAAATDTESHQVVAAAGPVFRDGFE